MSVDNRSEFNAIDHISSKDLKIYKNGKVIGTGAGPALYN